ncbi:helix-turn-helix transcriptional regulator [Aureimonas fodinaquatilis]|uniref:Helix-turn-helix transcriptional regulator n=1 Tax=Aureimonas fodinaquatilis TaxID=2565783 RepID=A0A5B0E2Q7_9HYPH|nr:AraC family transcriptional regulator [Aureimonas fodinaquatilis]KAA0972612.1 helix-turn-helix transcriptional regulator [Aureimonas fodinaquatilis]
MPSIPLPFVISLFLCLLLVRMIRQGEQKLGLSHLLIAAFAAQAVLSGLNWSVGWHSARFIQPVGAAILPALSFAAFSQLHSNGSSGFKHLLPHLMPAALVALLVAFWRAPIDVVLIAIYLGYGFALLRLARKGPEALSAVRIADEWTAHKALIAMAIMLIATAFIDAIISLDFQFGDGRQAQTVLAISSVLWLAIAGYAATVADRTRPDMQTNVAADDFAAFSPLLAATSTEDDEAIAKRVDSLMLEQNLYRDPDLTLGRLARRSGIPARQISSALNRVYSRNISQIVNEYRVNDAKARLVTTRDPVTTIMLESGFGTKSNFNREFLRVTGMTPTSYRRGGGLISAAAETTSQAGPYPSHKTT